MIPVIVIGGGIVGCAIIQKLSALGIESWLLEADNKLGTGISSRNSGVIHSGLYYPNNWLKTQLCIKGNSLLYSWCDNHNVEYNRCGKIVVGNEKEVCELYENAKNNNVENVKLLTKKELKQKQNEVSGQIGLWSPNTGIIDVHSLIQSFAVNAKNSTILCNTNVVGIVKTNNGFTIETNRGPIDCERIINSAGMYSDNISKLIGVTKHEITPVRGNYFRWRTSMKLNHLIYPAPIRSSGGLGVHATIDLAGGIRLGPDVQWDTGKENYKPPVNEQELQNVFYNSAKKIFPNIKLEEIYWDDCGIRPKRRKKDEFDNDFYIQMDIPNFINLIGIESPGLTSSMAIADYICDSFF